MHSFRPRVANSSSAERWKAPRPSPPRRRLARTARRARADSRPNEEHAMNLRKPLIGALAVLVMGGCASNTPYFDQQIGFAVNAAKAQQIVNPEASRNPNPVAGI